MFQGWILEGEHRDTAAAYCSQSVLQERDARAIGREGIQGGKRRGEADGPVMSGGWES